MIIEDYVSFEVAKLLKDKGFNEATNRYYNAQYDGIRTVSDTFMTYWNNEDHMKVLMMEGAIAIPTLQMVCKWLREEKNLCIYAFPHKDGYEYGKWEAGICYCDDAIDATINACGHIFGETYEDSVEEAIKYVLENLI